jgi:hypothetical protein
MHLGLKEFPLGGTILLFLYSVLVPPYCCYLQLYILNPGKHVQRRSLVVNHYFVSQLEVVRQM